MTKQHLAMLVEQFKDAGEKVQLWNVQDATWNRVHSPTKAAARPPADDALAAVLRAAKLEAFAPKFAEEKVGLGDLYEALDEGLDELSQLLAECGLKAGERSKLRRALDKARA